MSLTTGGDGKKGEEGGRPKRGPTKPTASGKKKPRAPKIKTRAGGTNVEKVQHVPRTGKKRKKEG